MAEIDKGNGVTEHRDENGKLLFTSRPIKYKKTRVYPKFNIGDKVKVVSHQVYYNGIETVEAHPECLGKNRYHILC